MNLCLNKKSNVEEIIEKVEKSSLVLYDKKVVHAYIKRLRDYFRKRRIISLCPLSLTEEYVKLEEKILTKNLNKIEKIKKGRRESMWLYA